MRNSYPSWDQYYTTQNHRITQVERTSKIIKSNQIKHREDDQKYDFLVAHISLEQWEHYGSGKVHILAMGNLNNYPCFHFVNLPACFHGNTNNPSIFPYGLGVFLVFFFGLRNLPTFSKGCHSSDYHFTAQEFDAGRLASQQCTTHPSYFHLSLPQILQVRSIVLLPFQMPAPNH